MNTLHEDLDRVAYRAYIAGFQIIEVLERRLDKKLHRYWDDDSPQAESTFGVRAA